MSNVKLQLDWCSFQAAKYAVEHWHYSKSLPSIKPVKIGVWENSVFVGTVVFSPGANQYLGNMFNLTQFECVELVRLALSPNCITPPQQDNCNWFKDA